MDVVHDPTSQRGIAIGAAAACLAVMLTACTPGGTPGGAAGGDSALCDAYPDGDIEFVVPYSAGGGFDTWARLVAPELQGHLANEPNIPVVNREGAGGITGVTEVFGSKSDGQTIVITEPGILATTQISGAVDTDFSQMTALGQVTVGPEVIVVKGDSPWESIEDVQDTAAERTLLMGTGGLAAVNIIAFDALGLPFTNVVHEGSSEAILSVIRGDTEITVFPLSSVAEGIRSGDLKPLVVVGTFPDETNADAEVVEGVPTLDEVTGEEGLGAALEQHRLIMGPPDLPECVVDSLSSAIGDTFADADFDAAARDAGLSPVHLDAAEAQAVLENTITVLTEYKELLIEQLEG